MLQCFLTGIGHWGRWNAWGSCYGNRQTRRRSCQGQGWCKGSSVQSRYCNSDSRLNNKKIAGARNKDYFSISFLLEI